MAPPSTALSAVSMPTNTTSVIAKFSTRASEVLVASPETGPVGKCLSMCNKVPYSALAPDIPTLLLT